MEFMEFSIQSRTVLIDGSVLSYLSKQSKKFLSWRMDPQLVDILEFRKLLTS